MRALWAAGAAIALLWSGGAHAQLDPARDHFRAGAADYKAGRYAEAITEFRAADQLRPSAALSFNIAQCYEKMADLPNARAAYQEYLERSPEASDRTAVENIIHSIDQRLAEQQAQPLTAPPAPPAAVQAPPVAEAHVAPNHGPDFTLSGILLGVGAAGLITGGVLNGISQSNASSLTSAMHDQSTAQGYYNTASNTWTGAIVGYSVGGGLLAIGAGLMIFELLHAGNSPSSSTSVSAGAGQ